MSKHLYKYENHKTCRRVVNFAPQERIPIEHSFRKSTATATKKNIAVSKSTSRRDKALQEIDDAEFAETAATEEITVSNPTSRGGKAIQKINPSAFSATFTPQYSKFCLCGSPNQTVPGNGK